MTLRHRRPDIIRRLGLRLLGPETRSRVLGTAYSAPAPTTAAFGALREDVAELGAVVELGRLVLAE